MVRMGCPGCRGQHCQLRLGTDAHFPFVGKHLLLLGRWDLSIGISRLLVQLMLKRARILRILL